MCISSVVSSWYISRGMEEGDGRTWNKSRLSKERNEVTCLSTHFLIAVLRMIAKSFCKPTFMDQGRTALLLFWNGQFQLYVLPALTSHIFLTTIMGLLCSLYYYSLRASHICNVNKLLSSQQFIQYGLPGAGRDYVLNAIQLGILSWMICGHAAITMKAETLAVERAVWYAKFGSVETHGVRPLICLEHWAPLKLKWCSWLQKVHCRGENVSECQSELFPFTFFCSLP